MTVEQFEAFSLYLGVGGLILYMMYVMYKLSKESKAGKFGTTVIFIVLGLGVLGFVVKGVIQIVLSGDMS